MIMTDWRGYEAREDFGIGAMDFERLIATIDAVDADGDFELGAPWPGGADVFDDDPE